MKGPNPDGGFKFLNPSTNCSATAATGGFLLLGESISEQSICLKKIPARFAPPR
jgi:hypothetical protein